MLATAEIKNFCDQMDVEYTKTTLHLIGEAKSRLRDVLSIINDRWFDEIRSDCNFEKFNLSFLEKKNTVIVECLKTLGWRDESDGTMYCPNHHGNLAQFAIGNAQISNKDESFFAAICNKDRKTALKCVGTAKNILNGVKAAYVKMFVYVIPDSNQTLFEEFKILARQYYDRVVSKYNNSDAPLRDDNLRKMFEKDS